MLFISSDIATRYCNGSIGHVKELDLGSNLAILHHYTTGLADKLSVILIDVAFRALPVGTLECSLPALS